MDSTISRRKWMGQMTALIASSTLIVPNLAYGTETEANPTTNLIKLSGNENPYGPSQKALEAIKKSLSLGNRYPFGEASALHDQLAKQMSVNSKQLLLGSGSSQLLQLLAHWAVIQKYPVTYPSPTFDILPNQVKALGGIVNEIKMEDGFRYDLDQIGKQARKTPGIIYLVNPNNPTGIKTSAQALRNFCKTATAHSYVIIDEAYIEYVGEQDSLVNMIHDNERIIIVRTFSKVYGLAGLRIGYLMAHAKTINKLKPLRIWNNDSLSMTGIAAARASLDDPAFIRESLNKNKTIRDTTVKKLVNLGIQPYASDTNFIFFRIPENKDLASLLKKRKMLIGQKEIGGINYARVTIGTKEEMNTFINHITNIY
ncbi:histidinol-phosphate transaminase [Ekhidna sp.]|jgi:histidinol-phosphate aminotransferase|uniref:pyridoxal phosphate-dependent aminotransferase n=1 Tax=Ekhidna sp. TaxID=2608089 RepID=UPI0032EEDFEE